MTTNLNSSLLTSSKTRVSISSPQGISRRPPMSSSYRKSSRFSTSGRSIQSTQVVLKATLNSVEKFGHSLPVLVKEALTFSERTTVLSAKISQLGFAWLVCGRRLLIWQYQQGYHNVNTTAKREMLSGQCFELQLPQSDLAHRAELISVIFLSGSTVPSCIAVSPEGVIRFWPSIAQESVTIEEAVNLQGQECDSLTSIDTFGCIIATTTCTIALVQPQLISGRHSLFCRTLKVPSGWLGGIGRRVSYIHSYLFGPVASEHSSETRLVRVYSVPIDEQQWILYMSAGHVLQKWNLTSGKPEQLLYMIDLSSLLKDGFISAIWENCSCNASDLDIWLLDIGTETNSVVILSACVNLQLSPQVHYALVTLPGDDVEPKSYQEFTVIKLTSLFEENNPTGCLSYRFLISNNDVYVYNQHSITVIRNKCDVETLDFNTQDSILGGSICVNTPIFFSRNNGLVTVSQNDVGFDFNVSLNQTLESDMMLQDTYGDLSIMNFDALEMCNAFHDVLSQMKAAFLSYVKKETASCEEKLDDVFSACANSNTLDQICVNICEEFLNDVSSGDPRWQKYGASGLGSSYSTQIMKQITDKEKCQNLYLNFLKECNVWPKLSFNVIRDDLMATTYIFGEFSEKLIAAKSLKSITDNVDIIDKAIDNLVKDDREEFDGTLTNQDIFYKNIPKIYTVIQEMISICNKSIHSDLSVQETVVLIKNTNEVILDVLKDVLTFRESNLSNFKPTTETETLYLPWTADTGTEALADSLNIQQNLTCKYGARMTDDMHLQNILYDQFGTLLNVILDGRKSHLESIKYSQKAGILLRQYQTDRNKLIKPLIEDKQWERATLLAEKYLDFESLVLICELTNNDSRLDEYMRRFSREGFSEFLYSWYVRENKQDKLIKISRKLKSTAEINVLDNFLSQHPSLSWISDIFNRQFDKAANTLQELGINEKESVRRQKTMLSMCKLARLATKGTKDTDGIKNINLRLELIQFQEELPDYVLEHFGYNKDNPRVIPPKDLLNLYICPEYSDATEMEFKKAIDLLEHIQGVELKDELRNRIWVNAIMRDKWTDKNLDSPIDVLKIKLFFKVAELSYNLSVTPQDILPPFDTLIEDPDIANLWNDERFQFLIKAAYEHFAKI